MICIYAYLIEKIGSSMVLGYMEFATTQEMQKIPNYFKQYIR
jgi:hypothetical protein